MQWHPSRRRALSGPPAAFLALALLAVACSTPAGRSRATSPSLATLDLVVVAGPVCPVERVPPDPSCAPRPVAGATIRIEDAAGRLVARPVSDAQGRISFQLPSGPYRLVPPPVAVLLGTPPARDVTVGPGADEPISLEYDTGIR